MSYDKITNMTHRIEGPAFLNPPSEIQLYQDGDIVTRSNFASWLIDSYQIGQANPDGHATYFEWCRVNHGLDWRTTLTNFLYPNGDVAKFEEDMVYPDPLSRFTPEEITMFIEAFKPRKGHKEAYGDDLTDGAIEDIIREELSIGLYATIMSTGAPGGYKILFTEEELRSMSKKEVMIRIRQSNKPNY